jgi:glycosyltransferase involved in cell wall biosynthesis
MEPASVSIIVPAHKEVGNLKGTIDYISGEMTHLVRAERVSEWEIIIVDSLEKDGSTDGTPDLASRIARSNPHVRVIHNSHYVNLGYKYRQGLQAARFEYYMMVPGKNTLHSDSIKNLLSEIPRNGIVIGYQADMSRRPFKRRFISKSFTLFMNLVFRLNLRYYNGTTVLPTKILRDINPSADDFAYMAEILVVLLKRYRLSYIQVPFYTRGRRSYGKTTATEWHNINSVAKTLIRLLKDSELRKNIPLGG